MKGSFYTSPAPDLKVIDLLEVFMRTVEGMEPDQSIIIARMKPGDRLTLCEDHLFIESGNTDPANDEPLPDSL